VLLEAATTEELDRVEHDRLVTLERQLLSMPAERIEKDKKVAEARGPGASKRANPLEVPK
jgi:hypothetical protein